VDVLYIRPLTSAAIENYRKAKTILGGQIHAKYIKVCETLEKRQDFTRNQETSTLFGLLNNFFALILNEYNKGYAITKFWNIFWIVFNEFSV